jgi:methionyl-tRNA synthetase
VGYNREPSPVISTGVFRSPCEGAEGKVLYVWFDAPIGYISATRQWAKDHGKDWEPYWKGEDTQLIHFIGKDNIVFHCIVFPAMLKAHGDYALPINVPANQFLNFEGRKFSKSKGWGIEQHQYLEEFADFPNKEGCLTLRFDPKYAGKPG